MRIVVVAGALLLLFLLHPALLFLVLVFGPFIWFMLFIPSSTPEQELKMKAIQYRHFGFFHDEEGQIQTDVDILIDLWLDLKRPQLRNAQINTSSVGESRCREW